MGDEDKLVEIAVQLKRIANILEKRYDNKPGTKMPENLTVEKYVKEKSG